MRFGGWRGKSARAVEAEAWDEMELVECGCGGVEMDEERSSTAGDALLMGSALSCCDPAAAGWAVRRSLSDWDGLARAQAKRGECDLATCGRRAPKLLCALVRAG